MKRSHLSISSFKLIMLIIGLLPPMLVGAQCFPTQNFSSSYTPFTVPSNAPQYTIRITVTGADGGDYTSTSGKGGSGAEMVADFTVDAGDKLDVYVGKSGKAGAHIRAGGGGGASAVVINESNVLIVAAGGGGSGGGTVHPDHGEGGRATLVSGAGGGSSFTGYAASGGGFGIQSAGDDGFGGSTGGEPGILTGYGRGGQGGINGGDGGDGFGAGGGAAAQVAGGGGGYKGGNGGVRPEYGGKGGKSFMTSGFSRSWVSNTDGVEGDGSMRNGSVKIQCLSFVVLPVELISFKGEREGASIKLDWQTESELNNKGFEIEHTVDGIAWENIGFVEGNGTTTENIDYEFIDTEPANGINYYRLKQVDFDGIFEYSTVISVMMSGEEKLSLFPNPTSGRVAISGMTLDNASLEIADNLGKMIRKETLNDQYIDISDLPNGVYFFTIKTADQTLLKRIVKED